MLLNASRLKKMFSDELLFDEVSFHIDTADKIGFVGVNGAGKSTLFKIILGEMEYDSGNLFQNKETKIGYLDQYACSESERSMIEEVKLVFSEVIETEQELEEIRFDLEHGNGEVESLVARQHELSERFSQMEGFYYMSKIRSTLLGLGFSEEDLSLSVSKLSGGQKTRVALAKILLSDANLLLLDEPTNHLDIASVEWLEEFLRGYKGAFVVISHDRYFLDRITNKTFELENQRFRMYSGNYSSYMEQKEIDKKTEQRQYENTMHEIERLEAIVEQQRRWNREKNIRTAESKQKVIEKLEKDLQKPAQSPENMFFQFRACPGGGQDVLMVEDLSMAFGENTLFRHVDLHIKKGEKVFLLGPNGCGKTTFLKILLGLYPPVTGEFKIGANIHIGYYDQIQENLDQEKNVIDEVWDTYPQMTQTEIRNALAVFLFRGEDVFKEIKKLSGGERARVELVKLILKKVNFLIMDEPTNHLDIESREALEGALAGYDGTMLMVSHDRYFMNRLADRILYLTPHGIESYQGNYDDFAARHAQQAEQLQQKEESKGKIDYKEQKRLESERRKLKTRFEKTEKEIGETEEKITALNAQLSLPEIATDYVRAAELTGELGELEAQLEALYEQWEQCQMELEEEE